MRYYEPRLVWTSLPITHVVVCVCLFACVFIRSKIFFVCLAPNTELCNRYCSNKRFGSRLYGLGFRV